MQILETTVISAYESSAELYSKGLVEDFANSVKTSIQSVLQVFRAYDPDM